MSVVHISYWGSDTAPLTGSNRKSKPWWPQQVMTSLPLAGWVL